MAQPCSDSPQDALDASVESGLINGSEADAAQGSLGCGDDLPVGSNGTHKKSDVFVRLVPISEMSPAEKKAVANREAKVVKEMEAVANKTMKAMMAKQIADKVKCVADSKDAELQKLRNPLILATAQQKVSSKLAVAQSLEGQLETARATQATESGQTTATVDKLECLQKAAKKAEVKLQEQAQTQIMQVKTMEASVQKAQVEAENLQDELSDTMKAERKQVAVLNKEACKTRAVAKKAQVQAVAAQREVVAATKASTEIVDGPPVPCGASPEDPACQNAITGITGKRPEELGVPETTPPTPAPPAPEAPGAGGITLNGQPAAAKPAIAAAAQAAPVVSAVAPASAQAAAAAQPPNTTDGQPTLPLTLPTTLPPTLSTGQAPSSSSSPSAAPPLSSPSSSNSSSLSPSTSASSCTTKYDCEGTINDMTGAEKDWCCAHKKLELCPNFHPRAGLTQRPLMKSEVPWKSESVGCPDHTEAKCLNSNTGYDSLEEAWVACGSNTECGIVLQHNKGKAGLKFYLRRSDDPVSQDDKSKSVPYA
jgi:hypothetical protein